MIQIRANAAEWTVLRGLLRIAQARAGAFGAQYASALAFFAHNSPFIATLSAPDAGIAVLTADAPHVSLEDLTLLAQMSESAVRNPREVLAQLGAAGVPGDYVILCSLHAKIMQARETVGADGRPRVQTGPRRAGATRG